mgnify:CR=1
MFNPLIVDHLWLFWSLSYSTRVTGCASFQDCKIGLSHIGNQIKCFTDISVEPVAFGRSLIEKTGERAED